MCYAFELMTNLEIYWLRLNIYSSISPETVDTSTLKRSGRHKKRFAICMSAQKNGGKGPTLGQERTLGGVGGGGGYYETNYFHSIFTQSPMSSQPGLGPSASPHRHTAHCSSVWAFSNLTAKTKQHTAEVSLLL